MVSVAGTVPIGWVVLVAGREAARPGCGWFRGSREGRRDNQTPVAAKNGITFAAVRNHRINHLTTDNSA